MADDDDEKFFAPFVYWRVDVKREKKKKKNGFS